MLVSPRGGKLPLNKERTHEIRMMIFLSTYYNAKLGKMLEGDAKPIIRGDMDKRSLSSPLFPSLIANFNIHKQLIL